MACSYFLEISLFPMIRVAHPECQEGELVINREDVWCFRREFCCELEIQGPVDRGGEKTCAHDSVSVRRSSLLQ